MGAAGSPRCRSLPQLQGSAHCSSTSHAKWAHESIHTFCHKKPAWRRVSSRDTRCTASGEKIDALLNGNEYTGEGKKPLMESDKQKTMDLQNRKIRSKAYRRPSTGPRGAPPACCSRSQCFGAAVSQIETRDLRRCAALRGGLRPGRAGEGPGTRGPSTAVRMSSERMTTITAARAAAWRGVAWVRAGGQTSGEGRQSSGP